MFVGCTGCLGYFTGCGHQWFSNVETTNTGLCMCVPYCICKYMYLFIHLVACPVAHPSDMWVTCHHNECMKKKRKTLDCGNGCQYH